MCVRAGPAKVCCHGRGLAMPLSNLRSWIWFFGTAVFIYYAPTNKWKACPFGFCVRSITDTTCLTQRRHVKDETASKKSPCWERARKNFFTCLKAARAFRFDTAVQKNTKATITCQKKKKKKGQAFQLYPYQTRAKIYISKLAKFSGASH